MKQMNVKEGPCGPKVTNKLFLFSFFIGRVTVQNANFHS